MKAGTVSLSLWHIDPGHHREVCNWHDTDHKPEVLGTTPNVFISQRWVASPAMVAARSAAHLPNGGGEYVNLYWTSGTPDELGHDFEQLGARLAAAGRMIPNQYIHTAWRTRTKPQSLHARTDQVQSAEAVPAAPLNRGLMVVVKQLLDTSQREPYLEWYRGEHIPRVLDTGLFTGAVTLSGSSVEQQDLAVLFYTDADDVMAVYVELQERLAEWRATGLEFRDSQDVSRVLHSSMYTNSIGQYEFYD